MLHPVGGLPSGTYWRRRAVLGGALLLSAVLIKAEIFGGSSDAATRSGREPAPAQPPAASSASAIELRTPAGLPVRPRPVAPRRSTSTPAPTHAVPAHPASAPRPLRRCAESGLLLRVTAGAPSYPLGALPVVRYSVTNRSRSSCRRDLGPALQEALVYDHADRLWSSNDCWPGVEHRTVTLRPGVPETFTMRWSRRSSLPECAGIRRVVPAGTYTLVGRVGGLIARAPVTLT